MDADQRDDQQSEMSGEKKVDPRGLDPTDRSHWHNGIYNNPDDPRGIVPRNSGHGSTVNFANKRQARLLLFAFMALLIPIIALLILISLLHH